MKQLFFALSLMLCGTQALSQLLDLVVEHHVLSNPAGQPEGTYTYRVYAELANSDDFLFGVYGHSSMGYCSSLEISTTTSFYNYAGIATTGAEINEVFFPIFPEIEADSWVTIGASNNTFTDGDITLLNGSGQTFESSFNVDDGLSFYSEEAYYYILPNQEVGLPIGPNNRVLLGQFTTSGALSLKLNMVVDVHGNSENRIEYVWDDTCIGSDLASGLEQVHPALTFGECNDPTAINYNAATSSNEDCIFLVGCTDPLACNYIASAITDDGSCTFDCGCNDPTACNYNADDTTDVTCDYDCGCNDPLALNYNPDDTGTADCEYLEGCMDPLACNYIELASTDDGSCTFDCGCNDPLALNYNPDDTGTADCEYLEGCMDPNSCLYDPLAVIDAGCDNEVLGCMDEFANNYDPNATCPFECFYTVQGTVFYDVNANGVMDDDEEGLPWKYVNTVAPGDAAVTDGFGNFTLFLSEGDYELEVVTTEAFDIVTTENPYPFTTEGGTADIFIGLNASQTVNNLYIETWTFPEPESIICNEYPNELEIRIENWGNTTLGGYVQISIDDIIGASGYVEMSPIDSIVGGFIYMSIPELGPSDHHYLAIGITGPEYLYEGQNVDLSASVYGFANEEQVCSSTYTNSGTVFCACDNGVLGCMDEFANNYDPNATCPFECFYAVQGTVFYDVNANGVMDDDEEGLPWKHVNTVASGHAAVTDDFGNFTLFLSGGDYELEVGTTEAFDIVTTENPYPFTTEGGTADIFIGLNASQTVNNLSIATWTFPEPESIICNEFPNVLHIWIDNCGNTTLGGYVQISIDDIIGASGYVEISPIDSIVGGFIYMSIPELGPSEFHFLEIGITGPEYLYEGQSVDLSASVYGIANDEQVCTSAYTSSGTVLCAYDPNDKQVLPKGYAEPHYIEPDTTLIYNVRFQNTGSFMAFDVLVRDTISEHLDLSTFALKAHSHCVQTFIDPISREVQFMFNNIMLPDSNCCEPDSHGMLAYSIRPLPDLVHNTLIENTAHIFFDLNPAIVTNTTWNSIFICDESFAGIDASALEICEGEELQFETSSDNIETQSWMLNGESAGDTEALNISPEPGDYEITLVATNPVCEQTGSIAAVVHPTPEVSFDSNENTLTASEGSSYQWYLNGNAIDGAIEQDFMISEEGQYSVDVISEDGCSGSSEQVFVAYVGISEHWKDELVLYPMPVDHGGTLYFSGIDISKISLIRVYDTYGKLMLERVGSTNQIVIGDWAAGQYILEIAGDDGLAKVKVIVR